jgi:flagellar protein FliS
MFFGWQKMRKARDLRLKGNRMARNPYAEHRSEEVLAAEPLELIVMLCRAAVDAVRESRRCLASGLILERSRQVSRAQEIVLELSASLNDAAAPELSRNLRQLYAFVIARLQDGNFRQADAPLAEAESILNTLFTAWSGCCGPQAGGNPYFAGVADAVEEVSVSCTF